MQVYAGAQLNRSRVKTRGFTLPEALIASAVLAFIVAGLTQTVVSGQAHTYNALHEERALSLAEALMEEVLSLPYQDRGGDITPGPDENEPGRANYDGMDDFHGFAEAAGALADPAGTLYPERFQLFSRQATAAYETRSVPTFGGTRDGLAVTVTVQEASGRAWTVERFVAEPAP